MKRVVVIEDSPTQAAHVRLLLEASGFSVRVAGDGEAGVAACREEVPDVVVTDVMMPGIDGFEVTRRLKADPRTRGVPVIVMTNLDDFSDVLRAIDAGADNYVIKPDVGGHLIARVRRAAEPARGSDPSVPLPQPTPSMVDILVSCLEDASFRNRELQRKQEELARANAQRDELVRVVAHELRGPLQALAMRASAARDLPDPATLLADLPGAVDKQVRTMVRIIDDLSDLTALDLGTFTIERESIALDVCVTEAIDDLRVAHPDRDFEVDVEAELRTQADPARIQQVLRNLLSNALKYSAPDAVVKISAERRGDRLHVAVRDEGVGIAQTDRDRVFDRYFRVDGVRARVQGVGLGLYICRRIVELHGGTIGVDSREDQGSTFWFELPVRRADD